MSRPPILLKTNDICPDGVRIVIDWGLMKIGASVFVPCVNTEEAKRQLLAIFRKNGWGYKSQCRIEGGKWGIRFWRTK